MLFAASSSEAFLGALGIGGLLGGLVLLVLAFILTVLAILMPYFVYRIYCETKKSTILLRQLLIAYGHRPEV